jgi:hypothetical protein
MDERYLFLAVMGLLMVLLHFQTRALEKASDRFERLMQEDRFYSTKQCPTCGRIIRIKVGKKPGVFRKECPEGCEEITLVL